MSGPGMRRECKSLGADQTRVEVDVVVAALGLRGYEEARKNCDDRDGDEDSHAPPQCADAPPCVA
jgi:hypothetical protein